MGNHALEMSKKKKSKESTNESSFKAVLNLVSSLTVPSDIKFITSEGFEASISKEEKVISASKQRIKLRNNSENLEKWLTFHGLGAGVGYLSKGGPVGISGSTQDLPSDGIVYKGLSKLLSSLNLSDLRGPGLIWSFGASAGIGISGSLIFFNTILNVTVPLSFSAALWLGGISIASPGLGAMTFIGYWNLDDSVLKDNFKNMF